MMGGDTVRVADTNKLYIVASCWTIIDTYYTMHGPLNIKLNLNTLLAAYNRNCEAIYTGWASVLRWPEIYSLLCL